MPRHTKYPKELRERAVRMVLEHQHEYASQWEAISTVAEKLGPTPETVRKWVRQAEVECVLKGSDCDVEDRCREPCCASDGGWPSGSTV